MPGFAALIDKKLMHFRPLHRPSNQIGRRTKVYFWPCQVICHSDKRENWIENDQLLTQAFFWTISQGTQGAKTSGTLSFFAYFVEFSRKICWVFEICWVFWENIEFFLQKPWFFSEKSFKFIQYSPAFYKITFFSFNISYPRYIFALQPSLVASKTSGTLSFAENGEENLRYLEF